MKGLCDSFGAWASRHVEREPIPNCGEVLTRKVPPPLPPPSDVLQINELEEEGSDVLEKEGVGRPDFGCGRKIRIWRAGFFGSLLGEPGVLPSPHMLEVQNPKGLQMPVLKKCR